MPHASLAHLDHRPWPIPSRPWSWRQSWRDLLFAHWPVSRAALRELVPRELELDLLDGEAWLGVVPFHMAGVMRRPFPDMPGISAFPELNLRTYVRHGDRAGVYFFSLDAGNRLAVWAARTFFYLPYFNARFGIERDGDGLRYRCERSDSRSQGVRFEARYAPTSAPAPTRDPRELFLTERYCLYARRSDGVLFRGEVHHEPWPLQHAEAEIVCNEVHLPTGLALADTAPLLHFAKRIDVVVWSLERLQGEGL
jgi:uncharacterized protein YqjF (DUF2071 family)